MLRKLAYFFIFLSAFITISHGIIAHHHHFETAALVPHSHHEDDGGDKDDDHNIFSFGQLDEVFIFSQHHANITNHACATLFLIPIKGLSLLLELSENKIHFITQQEFPPPQEYFYSTSLRGPPTV